MNGTARVQLRICHGAQIISVPRVLATPLGLPDERFIRDRAERVVKITRRPAAFLRRCIFHYLEFPKSEELLNQILEIHHPDSKELRQEAIEVILRLRGLSLQKKPGLSELIDWVGYLAAVDTPIEELRNLPYADILLKKLHDQSIAKSEFAKE